MKYCILTILSIALFSCNTRKDYFETINEDPKSSEVEIRTNTGNYIEQGNMVVIRDTLKTASSSNYDFKVIIGDEANKFFIDQVNRQGGGNSTINGAYTNEQVYQETKELNISFFPNSTGNHVIDYEVKDVYGKVTIVRLELFTFWNQNPVAKLDFENTQLFDPNEYRISAERSYDRDYRYGGFISEYEFKIGLYYTVTSSNNYINHIFSESGTYAIRIRVKDNNGDWSDEVSKIIIID
jgi:hypothetical protein